MDFFEAQARARQRTSRLVLLFSLAVLGTIVATYAVALFVVVPVLEGQSEAGRSHGGSLLAQASAIDWRPDVFTYVAAGTLAVVGLGSLYKWSQFRAGGSAVAASVGARRVQPGTTDPAERRLLNVVEEMAIASGVPVPAVYLLDDEPAINAFAAGLTTHDAVVAVTRGTLEKLTRDELQGVVAHEFSHILNGDMRLNVRLTAIIFGILLIGLIGRTILREMPRVRTRDRKAGGVILGLMALGLMLMIIGYIGYFFGRVIQAAVSRQREFLADASAVQFTRNPGGIAGALKKIGGYTLGSKIQTSKGAALGHFFFAQGYRAFWGRLWATHPPLPERIRAIDANFDGQMFAPPTVVDAGEQSVAAAGFAPARPAVPPKLPPAAATAALDRAGTLSAGQIADSRLLLDSVAVPLREAAYDPALAPVLVYGLLLSGDPAVRTRQIEIVATQAGVEARRQLDQLAADLGPLLPAQRLPLLHLALPVLRSLPAETRSAFLAILDGLIHADAQVSTFEFALQKLVGRTLALSQSPTAAIVQYQSFHAVADEIAVVLSALARAATSDPGFAQQAFAAGVRQLPLIASRLQFRDEQAAGMEPLNRALDKLAAASGPIKQRTLLACAHTVGADGQILIPEAELLRAIASALDCPMPPLTATV